MVVYKEYCDICGKDITDYEKSFKIMFMINRIPVNNWQACKHCQKMVSKYIKERKKEYENQN